MGCSKRGEAKKKICILLQSRREFVRLVLRKFLILQFAFLNRICSRFKNTFMSEALKS